jgi:hypothetical protein
MGPANIVCCVGDIQVVEAIYQADTLSARTRSMDIGGGQKLGDHGADVSNGGASQARSKVRRPRVVWVLRIFPGWPSCQGTGDAD